eukprot:TRINITY_DN29960_c0_g1_i1.p9 TRINITY_DN29960_c0_g1~~TRINITY_DN29960_c0_g1_i1.p9  ORF type:complete len:120 (+),score=10.39 TRINITY_DN29960_c0_g1_i1:626-985(+)
MGLQLHWFSHTGGMYIQLYAKLKTVNGQERNNVPFTPLTTVNRQERNNVTYTPPIQTSTPQTLKRLNQTTFKVVLESGLKKFHIFGLNFGIFWFFLKRLWVFKCDGKIYQFSGLYPAGV